MLNSQHNWGGPYDHLMNMRIFTFDNEWNIHMSSKKYEENDNNLDFEFSNHLILIACFKS